MCSIIYFLIILLENTLEELKKYDVKINSICMDAGFFSKNNIKEMYEQKHPFFWQKDAFNKSYLQTAYWRGDA